MFKRIFCFISLFLMTSSLLLGNVENVPSGPPPRSDLKEMHSKSAQIKLERAESILSTLVPDPQDYYLILSSNTSIGGEAVAPHVYSDKPTMIVYQGTLAPSRSKEEVAFVMAHELGHLNLYHNEKMSEITDKIFIGPPAGISGVNFIIFHQKLQERQADLYGLSLYEHAGYDLNFFPYTLHLININPNIHYGTPHPFRKSLSSLSMNNSHFSMQERFELLTALTQHSN